MKKTVLVIFMCIVIATVTGCNINFSPQTDDSGSQSNTGTSIGQDTEASPSQETEDSPSESKENGQETNLPVLDNTWKQIYLELFLTTQEYIANFDWSISDDYDSQYPRYISDIRLADLNFDGIPELIICGESVLASSDISIYTVTETGLHKIFGGLLHYGNGPVLYRTAPGNGSLVYGFTCLDVSSDDYSFTVYITDDETAIIENLADTAEKIAVYTENYDNGATYTFNGQNVTKEEYDNLIYNLFEGCTKLFGYPVSIIDIYPNENEYRDYDYIYSEDEILRFFNLYSPEYDVFYHYVSGEASYEMIVGYYQDFMNHKGDRDEAIENFLANMKIELNTSDEQPMYELESSLFELFGAAAGYAIRDINGDGNPELFIISEEDYAISAIYTIRGGNPVLVGAYWSRNRCVIDKNGIIYINGSNGASDSFSASYSLNTWQDGELLILIEMIGVESYDGQTLEELPEPRYYRIKDGIKTIISEEEAETAWSKFPDAYSDNPTRDSGLPYRIF